LRFQESQNEADGGEIGRRLIVTIMVPPRILPHDLDDHQIPLLEATPSDPLISKPSHTQLPVTQSLIRCHTRSIRSRLDTVSPYKSTTKQGKLLFCFLVRVLGLAASSSRCPLNSQRPLPATLPPRRDGVRHRNPSCSSMFLETARRTGRPPFQVKRVSRCIRAHVLTITLLTRTTDSGTVKVSLLRVCTLLTRDGRPS